MQRSAQLPDPSSEFGERGNKPFNAADGPEYDAAWRQRSTVAPDNIEIAVTNKPIRAHLHTRIGPQRHLFMHDNGHCDRIAWVGLLPGGIGMDHDGCHFTHRRACIAHFRPPSYQLALGIKTVYSWVAANHSPMPPMAIATTKTRAPQK